MNDLENATFFLVVAIGLEEIAAKELKEKWKIVSKKAPLKEFTIIKGGIEFVSDYYTGILLNKILKIPTRILLRINSFKCKDFPKLYKKISKVRWNNYLVGQYPEIISSSKESKLFDSRKIEKSTLSGIKRYYTCNTPSPNKKRVNLKVYLRFEKDLCTISIDTSGERLNKRSYRSLTAKAPIRENLAAALVYKLNSYTKETLIDPMCGSATFLIESALFNSVNNSRSYSFQSFPISSINRDIDHKENPLYSKLYGFDLSSSVIKLAKQNIAGIDKDLLNIDLKARDFFKQQNNTIKNSALILNPPYGKRLKISEDPVLFYEKILKQALKQYSPKVIGIIIPKSIYKKISFHAKIKEVTHLSLSNGGIDVRFVILKCDRP